MSHYLVERIEHAPNIDVRYHTSVASANGDDHLESLVLRDATTGERETVPAARHVRLHRGGPAHCLAEGLGRFATSVASS